MSDIRLRQLLNSKYVEVRWALECWKQVRWTIELSWVSELCNFEYEFGELGEASFGKLSWLMKRAFEYWIYELGDVSFEILKLGGCVKLNELWKVEHNFDELGEASFETFKRWVRYSEL